MKTGLNTEWLQHFLDKLPSKASVEMLIHQLEQLMAKQLLPTVPFQLEIKGTFERAYHEEILAIKYLEEEGCIHIQVAGTGIYDILPKGLFHQNCYQHLDALLDTQEEDWQQQYREEEQQAKTFFAPFDQMLSQLKSKVLERESNQILYPVITQIWDFPNYLNPREVSLLTALLPYSEQITGNLIMMQKCFELILGVNMVLRFEKKDYHFGNRKQFGLNRTQLNVASILDEAIWVNRPGLTVIIEALDVSTANLFAPGQLKCEIFKLLCDYWIPLEWHIETTITIPYSEQNFVLSDEVGESSNSRLDFSTFLE